MSEFLMPILRALVASREPAMLVTVAEARGSTPREAGAVMLVTDTRSHGTIGGGRLEWEATLRARAMLAAGEDRGALELPLGPAVGQCCGGHVRLALERADEGALARLAAAETAARAALPAAMLFGAGHVGRALAAALAPLPVRLVWADGRAEAFPPDPPQGVEIRAGGRLLDVVARAPGGAAFLVMTHSHAQDFEICEAVLRRGDFAYLGLIGSLTKRRRFERGFRELGISRHAIARLVCPIAADGPRDKRPAVIAALTAAEVVRALLAAPVDSRAAGD